MPVEPTILQAKDCAALSPRMFVVNHGAGESLEPCIQALLDPVRSDSYRCWMLARDRFPELHYHAHDEYWAWIKGRTLLTLRLPDGQRQELEIRPGWLVYLVRGVEHTHRPLENWGCFEWAGVLRPGAPDGHLIRGE
jgi:mannose-6-phosphate isomerase-like protein (cupin superfamily)